MFSVAQNVMSKPIIANVGLDRDTSMSIFDDKLRGRLNMEHATDATNVTRRFSIVLKENSRLLNAVRQDIKVLKGLNTLAEKINPLQDSIMARSDIYKTIAALRNAERSAISESTKIIERSIKIELDIKKNLIGKGDGSDVQGTSNVFDSFLNGGMKFGGNGVAGKGLNPIDTELSNMTSNADRADMVGPIILEETHTSDIPDNIRIPIPSRETPSEYHDKRVNTDDSISNNIESIFDDETRPVKDTPVINQDPTTDVLAQFSEGSMFDYGSAMVGVGNYMDNKQVVIAYDPRTKMYAQASVDEQGVLDFQDPTLMAISTMGAMTVDTEKMIAADSVGGKYNLVITSDLPYHVIEENKQYRAHQSK